MKKFIRRAKKSVKLVLKAKSIISQDSYYPNEPHKSKWQIFREQLFFIWKYGNYEKYYFAYGFDRKDMGFKRICNEYIINEPAFLKKIDYHNDHPLNELRHGRCIIGDKFYFFLFLKQLGFPTPRLYYYTRSGKLFYSFENEEGEEKIDAIFSNNIDAFAKPFSGQCGDGAFALKIVGTSVYVNNKLETQTDVLLNIFKDTNYIIQERVVQHPQLNKLCSSAVNTIRLLTVITSEGDVIAFRAGLRIGREGSNIDNCAKGGVFVGIDMNTGKLMKKGIIKPPHGTMTYQHPDSKIVFEGFEVPFFKESVELAKKLHSKLYKIHSIGWDIAITPDGPTFIEGNSKWEVSGTQAAVGGVKFIEQYFV